MRKLEPASWLCQSTLGEVRSKWVVVRAAEGIALLGAFAFLGVLLAFGLDNLLHLSVIPRLVLTFVLLGGIGAIGWMRIASPLLRKPSDDAVALLIERGKPDLENRLINAVQLSRETLPDGSVGFVELVRQDAADCLTRLGVAGVVPVRLLKRAAPVAVGSLAIVVAFATEYFLKGTTLGYKIRATGLGPHPAEAKGVNPRRTKIIAMALGGLVAGLAGAGDVLSAGHSCGSVACYQVGFASGWFGGEGFAGIAVALVAASNPIGAIFSAIFFSVLVAGSASVGASGLNVYLIWALQGLIIIFMSMPHLSRVILNARGRGKWT